MEHVGLPRRDEPCERCGWRYQGFHVCFDASKPCPGEGTVTSDSKKKTRRSSPTRGNSSEVQTARWEAFRKQHEARDERIVAAYESGTGLRDLAYENNISHTTVIKIIKREEVKRGETIMRPRGVNNRWNQKERQVGGGFQ